MRDYGEENGNLSWQLALLFVYQTERGIFLDVKVEYVLLLRLYQGADEFYARRNATRSQFCLKWRKNVGLHEMQSRRVFDASKMT